MGESPMASKKFLGYLLAETTWKIVLVCALFVFRAQLEAASGLAWWFMIAVVITAGFIEAGYLGGQTWLDRYVHVAEIAARGVEKGAKELLSEDAPTDPKS